VGRFETVIFLSQAAAALDFVSACGGPPTTLKIGATRFVYAFI
jgi:hypothetical protein